MLFNKIKTWISSLAMLVFCLASQSVKGQIPIEQLLKLKGFPIPVHPTEKDSNIIYFPMSFGSAEFAPEVFKTKLPNASEVYAIHLVYTRYRQVDTFNQPKLNEARFKNLQIIFPEVFFEKSVIWRVFEQIKPKTQKEAEGYYHGFVVYLKPKTDKLAVKLEIDRMDKVIKSYRDTNVFVPEKIIWKVKKRREETGYYLPRNKNQKRAGKRYTGPGLVFREKEYRMVKDSIPGKRIPAHRENIGLFDTFGFRHTHEYRLLTTKEWPGKIAVVADVTASMTPYNTQVMLWLKFAKKPLENGRFVFFNDGNNSPDALKSIGNTGGLHFAESNNFDSVYQTMRRAIAAGQGGDIPENNIEALLAAQKKWTDIDSFLMIADNRAPVKDLINLKNVKKPVNIILCGWVDYMAINDSYIQIAAKTKGKIYTSAGIFEDFSKLKINESIEFNGEEYMYTKAGLTKINRIRN